MVVGESGEVLQNYFFVVERTAKVPRKFDQNRRNRQAVEGTFCSLLV